MERALRACAFPTNALSSLDPTGSAVRCPPMSPRSIKWQRSNARNSRPLSRRQYANTSIGCVACMSTGSWSTNSSRQLVTFPCLQLRPRSEFVSWSSTRSGSRSSLKAGGLLRGTPPEQLTTFRGAEATHLVRSFDDVWKAAPHWQLRSDRGVHPIPTNLAALLAWARREGLLPGRRSRNMDRPLGALRNFAAHPTHYTLQTPPDSSRAIARSAEVINKLWGVDTPGGYLFSGPIRREPRVIGIDPVNHRALAMRVDQVTGLSQPETNYHFLVLLVPPEEDLWNLVGGPGPEFVYRQGVERTRYPCHELFSGSYDQLIAEIAAGAFDSAEDAVEYLDRRFLIRLLDGDLDDVRTPQDLLDVPTHLTAHGLRSSRTLRWMPGITQPSIGRSNSTVTVRALSAWSRLARSSATGHQQWRGRPRTWCSARQVSGPPRQAPYAHRGADICSSRPLTVVGPWGNRFIWLQNTFRNFPRSSALSWTTGTPGFRSSD